MVMETIRKKSKTGSKTTRTRKPKIVSKTLKVLFIVNSKSGIRDHFTKTFQSMNEMNHYGMKISENEKEFMELNEILLTHLNHLFEMDNSLIEFKHFFKYDELWEELVFTNSDLRKYLSGQTDSNAFGAVFMIDLKKSRYDYVSVFELNELNSQIFDNFSKFIFYDSNEDFVPEKIEIFLNESQSSISNSYINEKV